MKRGLLFLFALAVLLLTVQALDDSTYYGDGTSVRFSEIRNSLPALYRNTPEITVLTQSGSRTYAFNVEMFLDKGYLVYGDPSSVTDLGYTNSFKSKSDGYFFTAGYGSTRGEYRYLGLSVNGSVYTNNAFPSDTVPGEHEYRIVKYSSLPQYLKERYGITSDGNEYFAGIRDLFDSANSPAWKFVHNYADGSSVTVYDKFKESGLAGNGIPLPSLFEYARITGWGSGGGSLVLYYQSKNDSSVYRYATFTGDVTPVWAKSFPGLSCVLDFDSDNYRIGADSETVYIKFRVIGYLNDNYSSLHEILRRYTYTRDDILFYSLYSQGKLMVPSNIQYMSDKVVFISETITVSLNRGDLKTGYNSIEIVGVAGVNVDGISFSSECSEKILVFVEPGSTPTPTPSPTPEITPAPSVTGTPSIKRRW